MSEITKEDAYLRFNKELMRRVRVVAAVIKAVNEKGEPNIFATQRGCSPIRRLGIPQWKNRTWRDTTGSIKT